MNQLTTRAIILSRTNYQEADRILTVLTPEYGKLHLMARGVRKIQSKLAGGVELFSTSHITFLKGKGEVGTLISARLIQHYGNIVEDLTRTMLAYELTRQLDRITEDGSEVEYFDLLEYTLEALNDSRIPADLIKLWFSAQLLKLTGHMPVVNLNKATENTSYSFNFETMAFLPDQQGVYVVNHLKLLHLALSGNKPKILSRIQFTDELMPTINSLLQTMLTNHVQL